MVRGIARYLKFLFCLVVCFALGQPCSAQTGEGEDGNTPAIAVKRIALVDLDGVLRNADANNQLRVIGWAAG